MRMLHWPTDPYKLLRSPQEYSTQTFITPYRLFKEFSGVSHTESMKSVRLVLLHEWEQNYCLHQDSNSETHVLTTEPKAHTNHWAKVPWSNMCMFSYITQKNQVTHASLTPLHLNMRCTSKIMWSDHVAFKIQFQQTTKYKQTTHHHHHHPTNSQDDNDNENSKNQGPRGPP